MSAGVATQIVLQAGDGQTAAVNAAVAIPPSVVVRDASNNPVAGVGVTFSVATGGGAVTPAAVATDASGVAAATTHRRSSARRAALSAGLACRTRKGSAVMAIATGSAPPRARRGR